MAAEFIDPDDYTNILYKYTDLNGVQKILSNRTLRFTQALETNDPFDVYIDDLFGMDVDEFLDVSLDALLDALTSNPEAFAAACNTDLQKAIDRSERIRSMPDSERAAFRERFRVLDLTGDPRFPPVKAALETERDQLAERFREYGLFCATGTPSNLLMWAHYAEKHRGAVLGFLPDLAKDSFLRLIRPVKYVAGRPHLIEQPTALIAAGLKTPPAAGRDLNDRILHTKSTEWSYEEELRLTFPEEMKDGQFETFRTFYANELVEIYLGCRMSDDKRAEIIQLAKTLNPEVKIFATRLTKRKYALEFDPIP